MQAVYDQDALHRRTPHEGPDPHERVPPLLTSRGIVIIKSGQTGTQRRVRDAAQKAHLTPSGGALGVAFAHQDGGHIGGHGPASDLAVQPVPETAGRKRPATGANQHGTGTEMGQEVTIALGGHEQAPGTSESDLGPVADRSTIGEGATSTPRWQAGKQTILPGKPYRAALPLLRYSARIPAGSAQVKAGGPA